VPSEVPKPRREASHSATGQTPGPRGNFAVPEELREQVLTITRAATQEVLRWPPEEDVQKHGAKAWLVPMYRRMEVVKLCNHCLWLVRLPLIREPRKDDNSTTPQHVLKLIKTPEGRQELVRNHPGTFHFRCVPLPS